MFGLPLVILGVPSTATDPGERTFDDPAFGQDDEAFDANRPQHCLQHPAERFADPGRQVVAAVGAVGEDDLQPMKAIAEAHQDEAGSVVVLPITAVNDDREHQPQRIDRHVPLAAGDLLSRVVAPFD